MDITKLTVVELKALAYDELSKLSNSQENIKLINIEISKREKEVAMDQKEVTETK